MFGRGGSSNKPSADSCVVSVGARSLSVGIVSFHYPTIIHTFINSC